MISYIIPLIFLTVLLVSLFKRKNAYGSFVEGSREALDLIFSVAPYLITVMIAVEIFRQSGVGAWVASKAAPLFNLIGIPCELCELMLIRPLSGAGALAVLDNVFSLYGVDTYIGNCASVIYGSSETVFYLASIYFSKCKVRRLGYAIPVALLATFIGYAVGCAVLRLI